MRGARFMFLALVVRALLLVIERAAGIRVDFHPDAVYYLNQIAALETNPSLASLVGGGLENILYSLVGYALRLMTFHLIPAEYLLIAFNQVCVLFTVGVIAKMSRSQNLGARPLLIFLAASPYLAHLSIHPLKDMFVLLLTMLTFYYAAEGQRGRLAISGCLLILSRFYLGVAICVLTLVWTHLRRRRWGWPRSIAAWLCLAVCFYFLFSAALTGRQEVVFEGRTFYPNGFALVPDATPVRFFLGWVLNFLVPYPFLPNGLAEVGYFLHLVLFLSLLVVSLAGHRLPLRPEGRHLALMALFLFSFVLAATPGAGPLVRYRIAPEVLLLIGLNMKGKEEKSMANLGPSEHGQ